MTRAQAGAVVAAGGRLSSVRFTSRSRRLMVLVFDAEGRVVGSTPAHDPPRRVRVDPAP